MKRNVPPSPIKRHIDESPKLRELRDRRRKHKRRVLIFSAVLILLLAGGVAYASRIPKLQISQVVVAGNQVTDTDDIVEEVNKHLSGHYAYVIPQRNAFLYPKDSILFDLEKTFPRLRNIEVNRTSLNTLSVTVSEVRGTALWCGVATEPIDMNIPCYFTDGDGMIVAAAPRYSGNVYPRFFGGTLTNADYPLGQTFLPDGSFVKLFTFTNRVSELGFSVKAIRIGADQENALILDLGDGKTAPVRFGAHDDYDVLYSNFATAIAKEEFSNEFKAHKKNLEYIDLRFSNKVYYKFTPVAQTPSSTEEAE